MRDCRKEKDRMKLSIIIPYYNNEPYMSELMARLKPQITHDVELIVVDDGSKEPYKAPFESVKILRKQNGGVSSARNMGLDNATGDYIAFIDADDLVAENFVQMILQKIDAEKFDYCYLSWRCFGGGWSAEIKLQSINDKFPPYNKCVWNRIYRRDMIGGVRFNENKMIAEDAQFIREVNETGRKKAFIGEYMYFYRTGHGGNLTERFNKGEVDFHRTVIHYAHITSDMTWLIDEVKEIEKTGEAIILTNKNDIPELEEIAMVLPPRQVPGTDFKGEPTPLFIQLPKRTRTQVVIWKHFLIKIGGIETWIYNFCVAMKEYYDIIVVYDKIDLQQLQRLSKHVRCLKNTNQPIYCDTFIVNQLNDEVPKNIIAKHKIRLTHTCRMIDYKLLDIPNDCDHFLFVSEAARDTFNDDGEVIQNMPGVPSDEKALLLVSATRLTNEKGFNRMVQLAHALESEKIPFIWLVFTADQTRQFPESMTRMSPRLDIYPYLKMADYVVQLSDIEAFCYTIQEALQVGTPVLVTPLDVIKEFDIQNGKNGYVLPFDMQDVDVRKIYEKRPKVSYKAPKNEIISQWREILGNTTPKKDYVYTDAFVEIVCTRRYKDVELDRTVSPGERQTVRQSRAESLIALGVSRYV